MEFQLDTWLELFTHRLLDTFPGRVIFLGIQGSRGRGESKPDRDIDMVVVLDQVGLEDLRAYRELLRTLPHGGLTCGFFCGREELLHWPRYDLLQLVLDTKPLYGGLENLLPAFSPADTAAAVHIGAANLYHAACHCYLHEDDPAGCLASLAKSAFFLLRLDHYRRSGCYAATMAELKRLYPETGLDDSDCDACYQALIRWTSSLMGAVPEA